MNRRNFLVGSMMASTLPALLQARAAEKSVTGPMPDVQVLVFDTFGTVVDWRSAVIAEGEQLGRAKGLRVDWAAFADAWRAGYGPSMNRVRTGQLPWTKLDDLHRMTLDQLLVQFKIEGLTEDEKKQFNKVWHRLKGWPDSVAGLTRLKKRFLISPLSNGNLALLTDMAKFAGLPWDFILGSDFVRHYKPDKEVYLTAADLLSLKPSEMMMVAAHQNDLRAARGVGFRTAFVPRPQEGPNGEKNFTADPVFDVVAQDFNALAAAMGA